ncbi:MAG: iron donor protein CyaY [Myxococcales bacterium]|nr:iron donor protein CyaY [Myxococcales bacterium]
MPHPADSHGGSAPVHDEAAFDAAARAELRVIEDALAEVDPDDVDLTTSDGILRLELRDRTRVVINSHRAARQIWMAAVSTAWHFDLDADGRWRARRTGEELRQALVRLVAERIGVTLPL